MSGRKLDEYKKKRDFAATPEPEGHRPEVVSEESRRFVVQKHDATRLHYDLRLEIEGVLKCWAVPRGPSLDPAEKRLAVATEDHPLEYLDFEGVIPRGHYGAGNMIVWDQGSYECLGKETDPFKAWEKGTLDLRLHGQKLRGMWLLVRISGEESNWLFFKKSDRYADGLRDITEEMPESVLSGQRVEELVDGAAPTWSGPLDRLISELQIEPSEIQETVRPMLATLVSKVPAGPRWAYELKYDGIRALAAKKGQKLRLYSRNLKPMESQFPEIVAEIKKFPAENFLLDGEIVALDQEGRSSFQLLQSRINLRKPSAVREALSRVPVQYMVFDLLACQGYDIRRATFLERKKLLRLLLPENPLVREVDTVYEQGEQLFQLACEKGLEGILAKDRSSPYRSGRSPGWQKVKCTLSEFFVIGGWTEPAGGRKHFGALLLGRYQAEDLVFAGRVGTGFDESSLNAISRELQRRRSQDPPFASVPGEIADGHWVRPKLVCEVKFNEWTRDGLLRAPSFVSLRPDLTPRDCRAEPVENLETGESQDKLDHYNFLSNLEKIFWPDLGYTKRDLLEYYHSIAPVILPYLRDRPMNLERYPDGVGGKSFYQKDSPGFFPEWIRTVAVESDSSGKTNRYVVCDDRDTLVYLANLACIPLHPWSSRVGALGNPDFVILDLDPDPAVPFPQVCRFALKIRDLLQDLEVQSFPKTSGSKGLHILVPVEPVYSYEMVRSFAEIVARLAVHGSGEVATIDRSMERRKGKIYVDYLQNGRGKTIVSPYCLRPRPGAPVSTPLDWAEVVTAIRPEAFHMKNILRRLEHKGDLFSGVLTRKQSLQDALGRLEKLLEQPGESET